MLSELERELGSYKLEGRGGVEGGGKIGESEGGMGIGELQGKGGGEEVVEVLERWGWGANIGEREREEDVFRESEVVLGVGEKESSMHESIGAVTAHSSE